MMCKKNFKVVFCALLVMLLIVGLNTSIAEELFSDHVELFSEGAFPHEESTGLSTVERSDFNSYMLQKLNAYASEIDVSSYGLVLEDFRAAYRSLLNSRPEMFFVNGGYSYYSNGSYITRIIPQYNYSASELPAMQAVFNQGVNDIVNYAKSASTDIGRMLRANDYMCANFEYDTTYSIYSPELFFKNKTGVCQAYMLAYRAVLNRLGITNITVSSDAMNHTWNMVKLNGYWYHIDVTWNDPLDDVPLRSYHNNFLLSDTGIASEGHYDWYDSWETVYSANNRKYDNYFWVDLMQVAPMLGDTVYYVDPNHTSTMRNVYSHNLATGVTSMVCSYDYGYGSYYQGRNPIWVTDGWLYYAAQCFLMRMPLSGGDEEVVYSTGDSGEWIWHLFQSGTELRMHAAETPYVIGHTGRCQLNVKYHLSVSPSLFCVDVGQTFRLDGTLSPVPTNGYTLDWSSADPLIATVDGNGVVLGKSTGITKVIAMYGTSAAMSTVIVFGEDTLYIPSDTVEIEEEAFAGTAPQTVVLVDGVITVGPRAFADNEDLRLVFIADSVTSIANDAFNGCPNVTLLCLKDSAGERFAIRQKIPYELLQ